MKNFLNSIGTWTIKHHWFFLLSIIGFQWLTGHILEGSSQWSWLMETQLARQFHQVTSKLIFLLLILMAINKLWLYLKRKGKI